MFGFGRKTQQNKKMGPIGGLVGLAMFCAAASTLAWNETRTVKQANAIAELDKTHVSPESSQIDAALEGKPIYLSGAAETEIGAMDPYFEMGGSDTLMVQRKVEMYQWVEKRRDDKTYYEEQWDDDAQSGSGSYENPPFELQSDHFAASDAHMGAFQLDSRVLEELEHTDFNISEQLTAQAQNDGWRALGSEIYKGRGSPQDPQNGDHRVRFSVVNETDMSVMGIQNGQSVQPFIASNGYDLLLVANGKVPPSSLIEGARSSNNSIATLLRVGGGAGMALGMGIAFSGFVAWLTWIPLLGPLIGRLAFWTGSALGALLAVLLFMGAWLWAHPIWMVVIIAASAAAGFYALQRKKQNARGQPVSVQAMPPPLFGLPSAPPPMPPMPPGQNQSQPPSFQ